MVAFIVNIISETCGLSMDYFNILRGNCVAGLFELNTIPDLSFTDKGVENGAVRFLLRRIRPLNFDSLTHKINWTSGRDLNPLLQSGCDPELAV
jgi:hypothetical protein